MSIYEKADKKTGPYKLLALDGGGIRGVITLEVLEKIEATLRESLGDDSLVLGKYFDYIAGTSTGAIIATALSYGMSVAELKKFYNDSGQQMFDKVFILNIKKKMSYKYGDENLAKKLKEVFGEDTTFGSEKLKTLLMLVMRNATTDSPWPLSNNPKAKYNDLSNSDSNLKLPLWQLVRASTAAPTFFPPEKVKLGDREFIFVDGGVTSFNNPAFQLFLMATLEPYKLMWPTGEDNMLLVSVGTGLTPEINPELDVSKMRLLYNAKNVPSALMLAAQEQQDLLCRSFGKCLSGDIVDGEIGDMVGAKGPVEPKLFTYMRYNAELTRRGLDLLDGLDDIDPKQVQEMDSVQHIDKLERIGKAIAKQVNPEHFAKFLQ
ncbi:MAG: patatin [Oscillatoria sp. SIO1A7]|nr:patatin [Oscillatoria sp. SIO1A7]